MDVHLQFRSLRTVASLIASSTDFSAILQQLLGSVCQDTAWALGAVMSVDQKSGYAHVLARHDPTLLETVLPDRWSPATSPARLASTALARNQPVLIADASTSEEFPECREQAERRGYRTVVVVPMGCVDAEGRPMALSVLSRDIVTVGEQELAFLSSIVHLGAIAVDKVLRLCAHQLLAERLQTALTIHTKLLHQVLTDGSLASATAAVNELVPHPIVAIDFSTNQVIGGRTALPDRYDDDGWRAALAGPLGAKLMRAARSAIDAHHAVERDIALDELAQIRASVKVEPLAVDGKSAGALLVFPGSCSIAELDHRLLEGAKFALSVQMMRSLIRFQNETRTVADLFAELLEKRWRDPEDLRARASRLGITLTRAARLVAATVPAGTRSPRALITEMQRAIARCVQRMRPDGNVFLLDDTVVCHVPAHPHGSRERTDVLARSIAAETAPILDGPGIVIESPTCQTLEDYAAAWEQCRRIAAIARRFERRGLLSARDFGPYPLLLGAADASEVRLFVKHTIGTVVRHDAEHGTPYLQTLVSYLHNGCRHQVCADAMGLHVTTLRYRLARMQQLFDIKLDTAERRFEVQLALHLQAIVGEPPARGRARNSRRDRGAAAATAAHADSSASKRRAARSISASHPLSD